MNVHVLVLTLFGKEKTNKHDVFISGATKYDRAPLHLLIGQDKAEEA